MLLNLQKYIICCCFTVLSSALFAQVLAPGINFVDERGRKQGPWREINFEGLSYEGQFKDDRPYGRFRYFDRFDRTATFLDYFRDGHAARVTHFRPDGTIRATGFFLERLRDSVWHQYYPDGGLQKIEHYRYGMLHGLSEVFDSDGNLFESTEWYRNLRNGRWWQRTGRGGTQTVNYKFNLSHGIYEAHHPNGNLSIRGPYEEGLREGIWYYYHDDATLDRIVQFERSMLVRRQVAINVRGVDILIDTDSLAYMHTNGRMTELKMLDGTTYRPSQNFDRLVWSLGSEDFFLANSSFLTAFRLFESMEILPSEEIEVVRRPDDDDWVNPNTQRAILRLKIPTPYDVIIEEDMINKLRSAMDTRPIEEIL
jgi:antitoxin component YwqK of YwqJK toxin-antitoxin module